MVISHKILLVTRMDSACLARNASDAIKEQYLPGIVSGDPMFCSGYRPAAGGRQGGTRGGAAAHVQGFLGLRCGGGVRAGAFTLWNER